MNKENKTYSQSQSDKSFCCLSCENNETTRYMLVGRPFLPLKKEESDFQNPGYKKFIWQLIEDVERNKLDIGGGEEYILMVAKIIVEVYWIKGRDLFHIVTRFNEDYDVGKMDRIYNRILKESISYELNLNQRIAELTDEITLLNESLEYNKRGRKYDC